MYCFCKMAIAKYWAPLLLILAHILTSLSVGCAEIEETNDNDSINTTRVKVSDYFIPFEHCTMMVYTQGKFFRGTKRLTHGPLILLVYNVSISLLTGEMIHDKFSLVRRRNSAPHCWATFTILPEKAGLFEDKFMNLPCFISRSWPTNYFNYDDGCKPHSLHVA